MNIVLVTETYAPEINGVAMTLGRLVDGLAARGHRLTIIRPRQRHESPRFSVTQRLACRQVRLPGVPIPGYPQLRLGLPAGRRLRQLWTLNRPDLVHVATEGPLGASAITMARQLGIPVTSSFHTNFDQYTRDYRIGWMKPIVAAWLRHVHNRTLRTFAPTRDLLARLETEGYQNLRLLSRGVDSTLFNPGRRDGSLRASWGVGPEDPVVLHVGRIAAEKNYPLLFRAFDAIKAVQPRARLVLVGDGPLLSAYQRQRPDVMFTGFYTGTNLARHYASGDIYLHTSITETFGNVVTEALGSGLAVSAFDYAAAHEFIRHGENGLTAPVGDEAAFIANAVRLAREPTLRERLATQGALTARGLTWDAIVDRFLADLQEAANEFDRTRASGTQLSALSSQPSATP
ncbi:glycosyltransferase family 1 protein [Oleiharenicola lentus]|uniref:Glycosyltransferase family 1 protein n=1 Tax=Oleiharenicola lentus TaxID=2508720 RepID=A0A4Q1C9C6_9BACT|nr:glycosyltransferase family 1 protein [Oleiharenicola lentus]RXK55548.1 glycosyltransferase family 1 protein [Oleiharenicola lentus]